MNDLRLSGSKICLTDSGLGALIIRDMTNGKTVRRLSGRNALMAVDKRFVPIPEVLQRGQGQPSFRPPSSDMIKISADGAWLYWAALSGPLFRMQTRLLDDRSLSDDMLEKHIEVFANIPFSAGCAMDTKGNFYLSESGTGRILLLSLTAGPQCSQATRL